MGDLAGSDCARRTRACLQFSPARPCGAETQRFPAGRAFREQGGLL